MAPKVDYNTSIINLEDDKTKKGEDDILPLSGAEVKMGLLK